MIQDGSPYPKWSKMAQLWQSLFGGSPRFLFLPNLDKALSSFHGKAPATWYLTKQNPMTEWGDISPSHLRGLIVAKPVRSLGWPDREKEKNCWKSRCFLLVPLFPTLYTPAFFLPFQTKGYFWFSLLPSSFLLFEDYEPVSPEDFLSPTTLARV